MYFEVVDGIPVKRAVSIIEIRQNDVLVSADLKAGTLIINGKCEFNFRQ